MPYLLLTHPPSPISWCFSIECKRLSIIERWLFSRFKDYENMLLFIYLYVCINKKGGTISSYIIRLYVNLNLSGRRIKVLCENVQLFWFSSGWEYAEGCRCPRAWLNHATISLFTSATDEWSRESYCLSDNPIISPHSPHPDWLFNRLENMKRNLSNILSSFVSKFAFQE